MWTCLWMHLWMCVCQCVDVYGCVCQCMFVVVCSRACAYMYPAREEFCCLHLKHTWKCSIKITPNFPTCRPGFVTLFSFYKYPRCFFSNFIGRWTDSCVCVCGGGNRTDTGWQDFSQRSVWSGGKHVLHTTVSAFCIYNIYFEISLHWKLRFLTKQENAIIVISCWENCLQTAIGDHLSV